MTASNFTKLPGRPVYLVRTQAGFVQALKNFDDETELEYISNYPKKYPCVVFLSRGYSGYFFTRVTTIPFDVLTNAILDNDYSNSPERTIEKLEEKLNQLKEPAHE